MNLWLNFASSTGVRNQGQGTPSAASESNADNPGSIHRYLKKRKYRRVTAKINGHVAGLSICYHWYKQHALKGNTLI
jgi:hypothetical protein